MTDPHAIARAYIALWNDADDASRRDRLSKGWSANARYADPMMQGTGHDGIAAMIGGARAQFPGHSFTLAGTPDGHGDFVRFSWTLAPDGGATVAAGTDVVRLDADGRIWEVIGFLDGGAA
ncbi:MAG: nuclear transport factor 2 family protein [Sphingobium sp.]|jgi:hypothetical protein|nr:MAG: nuclear transport factor 2 family protein [Sphingobium sp.]